MDRRSDSPAAGRRLSPAAVALLYAAFAVLWIVASGALLTLSVADAALQEKIELGKGLLFVAVSASLLYLVLKYWISPLPEVPVTPRVPGRPGADRRWRVPLLLLVPLVPGPPEAAQEVLGGQGLLAELQGREELAQGLGDLAGK